jgi:ABC-2 type transport system permease protein
MKPLWKVAAFEYRRNVFKKSFLFVILSVPCFIAFSIGMGFFIEKNRTDVRPVGIVDDCGVIRDAKLPPGMIADWAAGYAKPVEFILYATEQDARLAVESNRIQAYYLLPADYYTTRQVEQRYIQSPGENAEMQFFDFLQLHLAAPHSPQTAIRAAAGNSTIVRSLDGHRLIPAGRPTFSLLMPFFIVIAFFAMIMMGSGYMQSAVTDEKENRTMEILLTSISPFQLIGGKILGIVAISFTLLLTWTVIVLISIFIAAQVGVAWFNDLSMDWRTILASLVIAIPAYVLATALMIAIGSMIAAERESQPVGMVFVFLHLAPIFISWSFINHPHSTLAVILSLLPFTSMLAVGMRNIFTIVPAWQVLTSSFLQSICALGAIWLASRAFHHGMLRYGQRLNWRRVLAGKSGGLT